MATRAVQGCCQRARHCYGAAREYTPPEWAESLKVKPKSVISVSWPVSVIVNSVMAYLSVAQAASSTANTNSSMESTRPA